MMNKKFYKEALFLLLILFAGFFMTVNHLDPVLAVKTFGFKLSIAKTHSMKPILNKGDIAIIKPVDVNEIAITDVIAFKIDERFFVCHTVAEIIEKDIYRIFKTKPFLATDKKDWDYWGIREENIIGKVEKKIPYIGHLFLFLKSKIGVIQVLLTIIILIAIRKLMKGREENENKN